MFTPTTQASLGLISFLLLLAPSFASAQPGVEESGMGQGEAEISAVSNVQMGIRNGAGTSGERLTAMTDAVGSTLGDVRRCYARIVESRPTLVGTMRINAVAEPRRRPRIEVTQNTHNDEELTRCVTRFLGRARYPRVDRSARVTVTLEFSNTSATGTERMRERTAIEAAAPVTRQNGRLVAMGGTPGGEIGFRVSAPGDAETAAVQAAHEAIRTRVAGLLDCRRRAGRRGANAAGEMNFSLLVPGRGRTRVTTGTSTVANERAPICSSRVLSRARYARAAAGRYEVSVRFSAESVPAE